jgi:hypothetical protein
MNDLRYYYAVWVDFLHGPMCDQMALNVQETDSKGGVIRLHRKIVEKTQPPTEAKIVDLLLPGAKEAVPLRQKDGE